MERASGSAPQRCWISSAATEQLQKFRVGGVGNRARECDHKVAHPVGLEGRAAGSREAPVIRDSDALALRGLGSSSNQRAFIDASSDKP